MELERLNGLRRRLESSNVEGNTARNRFGRSTSDKGSAFADYIVDKLPYSTGGRTVPTETHVPEVGFCYLHFILAHCGFHQAFILSSIKEIHFPLHI
jgi:hypothetical protein